ncbi:putative nuclease HARBI1 [Amborella trichopoda]|uniref:putative nuclease HARBI1 n=1 Tax=Amborella trichopoda TaxID=13333 RepID=UPI0009C132B7|nr:putative nuclease HARBI1 [Amborella trichopoda]|eukprot:XP_020531703.1 putative nuclease HARBI1 [Amborella trichopoda]
MIEMELAKRHEKQRRKQRLILALALCSYNDIYVNKIPLRNSSLSGYAYMEKILLGHRERCLQNCIGAIDSTHIHVSIGIEEQAPYWNRKGFLSQNVMVACSFDLRFVYVLVEWDESSSDSSVLKAALKSSFKAYGQGNLTPQNVKELFNLRHSSLRNVIECAFGVLKKRFPILKVATTYPYETQVKIVAAAWTLHNHIRTITGGDDWLYEEYDRDFTRGSVEGTDIQHNDVNPQANKNDGDQLQDHIAKALWDDYCTHH